MARKEKLCPHSSGKQIEIREKGQANAETSQKMQNIFVLKSF